MSIIIVKSIYMKFCMLKVDFKHNSTSLGDRCSMVFEIENFTNWNTCKVYVPIT